MSDFDGKVAIVTGGGSGLGEAISKELAAKGAKVIVSDINPTGAERVTQEITDAGGTASALEQDTAQPAQSEKVVRHAVDTYGGLHLAVNNAGIGGPQAPAGETDLEAWDKVLVHHTRRAWKLTDHYTIDCTPDAERTLDRRLVLAAAVGMDALQAR